MNRAMNAGQQGHANGNINRGQNSATGYTNSLPIFNDPEVARVKRVAVIDVGSNSVRLVVFDGAARSPAYFYNEKVMCGLGASLTKTKKLDIEGKSRALNAIRRFMSIAEGMNVSAVVGIATAAFRQACDGQEFCREIQQFTQLKLNITSGHEEARLAAQGVILGWPEADGLTCDIGGASMEVAEVSRGQIGKCLSSELGPLLFESDGQNYSNDSLISKRVRDLYDNLGRHYHTIYLVGGSWRAIAKCDMLRRNYPLRVMNEYLMPHQTIAETLNWIKHADLDAHRSDMGISSERIRLVPIASRILSAIIEIFKPQELVVSAYGIREGILYDQMPEKLRQRDPLIEACLHAEHISARLPGYGLHLFKFIKPLFKSVSDGQQRLIKAACILHDVSWRAHPDYRAISCFDYATRASLAGLDHPGRVFLASALFNRYKNHEMGEHAKGMLQLLKNDEIVLAALVGKAMRFGAMLTVLSPDGLGKLKFKPRRHELILELPHSLEVILGEVVKTRFQAIAQAMNCEPRVQIVSRPAQVAVDNLS